MATEKKIECTILNDEEVAIRRKNIQRLAAYIGNKRNPELITHALRRLASEICVQEINKPHTKL